MENKANKRFGEWVDSIVIIHNLNAEIWDIRMKDAASGKGKIIAYKLGVGRNSEQNDSFPSTYYLLNLECYHYVESTSKDYFFNKIKDFRDFEDIYVDGIFSLNKDGIPYRDNLYSDDYVHTRLMEDLPLSYNGKIPFNLNFNVVSISKTKTPELSDNLIKELKAGRTVVKKSFGMDVSKAEMKQADATLKNMRSVLTNEEMEYAQRYLSGLVLYDF